MRWVLLLLVAANIGYCAWQQLHQEPIDAPEPGPQRESTDAQGADARLELVSETDLVAAAKSEPSDPAPEPPPQQESRCWMYGPFVEKVTAKQVLLRFQNHGVPAELRNIEVVTGLDYLLYIGPFESRAIALTRLRELQAAEVDSFLITRGELIDAISLGLFSSSQLAESARQKFEELGYEVQVRDNERTDIQQWLFLTMADADSIETAFWDELDTDFSGLERKQNWCDAIASADSIE